jgi:hypothetical protein
MLLITERNICTKLIHACPCKGWVKYDVNARSRLLIWQYIF